MNTIWDKIFRRTATIVIFMAAITLLKGCSGGSATQSDSKDFEVPVDIEPVNIGGDGDLFEPTRLLEVSIELDEDDLQTLRSEGRSLASTARECIPDFEYTEFEGSVTIDGDTLNKVVIRKKGFLGSLSRSKPSFKFDFDELQDGRTYQHMTRMTLNNNRQDPSNARQCMAYDLFRAAGLVAPRCNLARVTVNGEFYGIYTNVEPIKKPFLKLNYGDKSGNLYEAQIADFGQFSGDKFEKKTNEKENGRSDLQAVADAFSLPEEHVIPALAELIDLEEFVRFWAMETLLGHWDSASGNANNFYIYQSPVDNLFHFIPWGADASFNGLHPLKPGSGRLYRNFNLASKLYQHDEYRAAYYDTINEYLATIWNEADLLAEIDRIALLTNTDASATASLSNFISGKGEEGDQDYQASQRAILESAMAGDHAEVIEYLIADAEISCTEPITTQLTGNVVSVSGSDSGTFGFKLPSGHVVNASISAASFAVDAIVQTTENLSSPSVVSLLVIGADTNDDFTPYVLQIFIEEPEFVLGTKTLHGFATNLMLFEVDESLPLGVKTIALGSEGTISIKNIGEGASAGDVSLTINAELEYVSEGN